VFLNLGLGCGAAVRRIGLNPNLLAGVDFRNIPKENQSDLISLVDVCSLKGFI